MVLISSVEIILVEIFSSNVVVENVISVTQLVPVAEWYEYKQTGNHDQCV